MKVAKKVCCRFLLLILLSLWCNLLSAQLTADSIRHYLTGKWVLCDYGMQNYYWDSDAATDVTMKENDAFSLRDSSLMFYADSTFSLNGSVLKQKYGLERLLKAYESPFKILLGETEYIFEIRDDGFFLRRLILGTLDEIENHFYFFSRPGTCEDQD